MANRCGKNNVMDGSQTIIATRMASDIKNGITPLNVSIIGTSFAIELITKTFIPTGGVIRPTSTTISDTIPNQSFTSSTGIPKSRLAIIGQKIGTVKRIIDRLSIINPRRMYIITIITIIVTGGNPEFLK